MALNSFLSSSQEAKLKGHWRRIDVWAKYKDTLTRDGDLLINSDSTFYIIGYNVFKNYRVQGWSYDGGTIRGKWFFTNKVLSFAPEGTSSPGPPITIIKLTKSDFVFRYFGTESFPPAKYKRVQIK